MSESSTPYGKLAILYDKNAKLKPSNPLAIQKFIEHGKKEGYQVDIISRVDSYRLFEYDILFIRETTARDNHTYEMVKTAENLGLAVIDDSRSIEICCDKEKQYQLFKNNNIPTPKTLVINQYNIHEAKKAINSPYILKNPYGCFSYGVFKVESQIEYERFVFAMLTKIDKVIVQEFIQTDFDWRIGILDNKIIFACKYYMTKGHWKTIKHNLSGEYVEGDSICIHPDKLPHIVSEYALRAAALVGSGLYGVDIKQPEENRAYVIEINDNPNIDAGIEDALAGNQIYEDIILHLKGLHCLRHHGL